MLRPDEVTPLPGEPPRYPPIVGPEDWQPLVHELQAPPLPGVERGPAGAPPSLLHRHGMAIHTPAAWRRERAHLLAVWQAILGPEPCPPLPAAPEVVAEYDALPDYRRWAIRFRTEEDATADAHLLLPGEAFPPPWPGVVVFHRETDAAHDEPAGLAGAEAHHVALELARLGYACLVPRHWWFGYDGATKEAALGRLRERHPLTTGLAKAVWDGAQAIDALLWFREVDPRQVAAIGHGMGAQIALFLAAQDERIAATIASEPGLSLERGDWAAPWSLGATVGALRQRTGGHDLHEIVACIAPRAFLLVAGGVQDGAASWPSVHAAQLVYDLLGAPEAIGWIRHADGDTYPLHTAVTDRDNDPRDAMWEWLHHWVRPPRSQADLRRTHVARRRHLRQRPRGGRTPRGRLPLGGA